MRQTIALLLFSIALLYARNPSFDPAKASTKIEKLIVSDSILCELDYLLDKKYREAIKSTADSAAQAELKQYQRNWLKSLNGEINHAKSSKRATNILKYRYIDRIDNFRDRGNSSENVMKKLFTPFSKAQDSNSKKLYEICKDDVNNLESFFKVTDDIYLVRGDYCENALVNINQIKVQTVMSGGLYLDNYYESKKNRFFLSTGSSINSGISGQNLFAYLLPQSGDDFALKRVRILHTEEDGESGLCGDYDNERAKSIGLSKASGIFNVEVDDFDGDGGKDIRVYHYQVDCKTLETTLNHDTYYYNEGEFITNGEEKPFESEVFSLSNKHLEELKSKNKLVFQVDSILNNLYQRTMENMSDKEKLKFTKEHNGWLDWINPSSEIVVKILNEKDNQESLQRIVRRYSNKINEMQSDYLQSKKYGQFTTVFGGKKNASFESYIKKQLNIESVREYVEIESNIFLANMPSSTQRGWRKIVCFDIKQNKSVTVFDGFINNCYIIPSSNSYRLIINNHVSNLNGIQFHSLVLVELFKDGNFYNYKSESLYTDKDVKNLLGEQSNEQKFIDFYCLNFDEIDDGLIEMTLQFIDTSKKNFKINNQNIIIGKEKE